MSFQRHPLAVRAFGAALRLSQALSGLPNRITPPPFRLMQIGSSFWQSRVLYVAARLDLASLLADKRLGTAELAAASGADARALGRLLRMLAAMGIFEEVEPGVWRNNRLSDPLRTDRHDSVRAIILMHNAPEMSRPWFEQLEAAVRTGAVPFELTHGAPLYAVMDQEPAFNALFAQAMDQVEALTGDSFATDFDWGRFGRILDIGGARGGKSAAILKRHPHLRAVVVDRAETIREAEAYWAGRPGAEDCWSRLTFETGDVLSSVPAAVDGRDVYLLSAVLHGFDDAACVTALSTVAGAAAPAGAHMVLMELVMPESKPDLASATFDMQMFMGTRGGERTMAEWQRLFARSGVTLVEVVNLASFGKMLVLRPAA